MERERTKTVVEELRRENEVELELELELLHGTFGARRRGVASSAREAVSEDFRSFRSIFVALSCSLGLV